MKSGDPDRYELVERIENMLLDGEEFDGVGRALTLPDEDALVDLESDDYFWVRLAESLYGAISADGSRPLPSEEDHVLRRLGIRHPENMFLARETLRYMWAAQASRTSGESARSISKAAKDVTKIAG